MPKYAIFALEWAIQGIRWRNLPTDVKMHNPEQKYHHSVNKIPLLGDVMMTKKKIELKKIRDVLRLKSTTEISNLTGRQGDEHITASSSEILAGI